MSTLLGSLKSAISHEGDKRKFFNILGNPASSTEERADAYNGLMSIANHQDWQRLCSQFEQNLGELNSKVMGNFFAGAAQHFPDRLKKFVEAEDGIVLFSVKEINKFTEFAGAAIFLAHRAISGMEALGMIEELKAFAEFVVMACDVKANNGLVPRKLFEERLKQYLPADVVEDQEKEFQRLYARRQPTNGGDRLRKAPEGHRPPSSILPEKNARHLGSAEKDEPINAEGHAVAARVAGTAEDLANRPFAGLAALVN